MGVHYTKRVALGPFQLNVTGRGLSSVSLRAGQVTANTRRGLTVRLPFGLTWRGGRR